MCESEAQQQHDVGHEGVITESDGCSLRSSIADPQGVAQSERKSTTRYDKKFSSFFH
ncbi:hypothetical protein [Lysinibacillus sp. NPDC096212]|uniref:hypothetical protein n=1 Tax=Lysinibacillus sp. NPDC096212 TaxID=3364135 RepID=UPI0038294919